MILFLFTEIEFSFSDLLASLIDLRKLVSRDNKFSILPEQLKDFTDFIKNRELMFNNLGLGYNEKENDSRINYTGRFNG